VKYVVCHSQCRVSVGFKLWEGSVDLANFLIEKRTLLLSKLAPSATPELSAACSSSSFATLELGCGHGLPSIVVMHVLGSNYVCLSDFNASVLRDITWPNILLNKEVIEGSNSQQLSVDEMVECWSGDWMKLSEAILRRLRQYIIHVLQLLRYLL
jgi:hypothetical protein